MNPSSGYGMILLIEKSSGTPVGHVSAVINANSTGWVSMFIVDERFRGQGLGRELFKVAERDLERNNVAIRGLDAVVEQKQTCRSLACRARPRSDTNIDERRHFVSSPLGTIRIMIRELHVKLPLTEPKTALYIVDIHAVPLKYLVEIETRYTGFVRPALWSKEHMFDRSDVCGFAAVANPQIESVNDLKAWVVTRRCSGGIRIGPVYGSDRESAQAVLVAAMKSATPASICDVPLPNESMHEWPEDKVAAEATLVAEVWGGNAEAIQLFDELGWRSAGVDYYRMWVNGKATPEQSQGGASQAGVFAIFDAAVG